MRPTIPAILNITVVPVIPAILCLLALSATFAFGEPSPRPDSHPSPTGRGAEGEGSPKANRALCLEPIDISGFDDSSNHWRGIKGDYFIKPTSRDQPRHDKTQVREIAENLLLFQRSNGGWPKDYDMCAILTPAQRATIAETRDKKDTSFDNDGTHPQVAYLAKTYSQTRDPRHRAACLRGLDFILSAQLKNGGFPQWHPNTGGYRGYITYNDNVMLGILRLLDDAAKKRNGFEWLDDTTAAKATAALARGIRCILATQYTNKAGVLQGWGQQHDPATMLPAKARVFEHASLSGTDTADIVRFLMKIENPAPEVIRSIRAACAWLEAVKITGIRVEKFKSDYVEMRRHNTSSDRRVVADPGAPPLWARMYELETNRPIFSGTDGVVRYNLSEIDRDRRTGYGWYGTSPAKLLEKDYPAWLKKN